MSLLAPQLTAGNAAELLAAAQRRTADEIRRMLADRQPKADVASLVKRVKQDAAKADAEKSELVNESGLAASASAPPVSPFVVPAPTCRPPEPLGEERYLIRFTAGGEFYHQIQQLKALMCHQISDGDVGKILAKAAAVLLKPVRARKFGECSVPRAARGERAAQDEGVESAKRAEPSVTIAPSRQIPAAIRRAVSKRDGERCTFVAAVLAIFWNFTIASRGPGGDRMRSMGSRCAVGLITSTKPNGILVRNACSNFGGEISHRR